MMQEVTSCQIALEDLQESPEGEFWREEIEQAIGENHFKILLHPYLSHYLAEPSQVLLDQGHADLLPPLESASADPGSEVQALLEALKATAGLKSRSVIAGVDIGGTFVKIQFYQLEEGEEGESRLSSWDPGIRMLTAAPSSRPDEDPLVNLSSFLDRLGDRIQAEIKALHLPEVDAVGVSWPGPVRRQRVQGTSGLLAQLGFSRDIPRNDIGLIMKMDIVGGLASRIFGAKDGVRRTVTLINDGNAHALGILAEAYVGRRLRSGGDAELGVVLKAGTGTAGALILNGLPAPGLMEFGKLVANLAYECVSTPQYPKGVANEVCSKKTLPALMQDRLKHLEKLEPPVESVEVGRLAEVSQALQDESLEQAREVLSDLIWDSGKIAVAALLGKIDPELDVVALEELNSRWSADSHQALREKVIQNLALGCTGDEDGVAAFRERIRAYGEQRLLLLLDAGSNARKLISQLFEESNGDDQQVKETLAKLNDTAKAAKESIRKLGSYIGDLLALLYYTHRMRYAVLGGGVLAQTTGLIAREAAIERLNKYNEINAWSVDLAGNLGVRFLDGEDSPASTSKHDPGTLGAALAGGLELLRQKRLEGLKRVIEMVHRLELMKTLEITETEVKAQDAPVLSLQGFALDAGAVRRHLDQASPRLGLVRTLTNDQDKNRKYTYTRWLAG